MGQLCNFGMAKRGHSVSGCRLNWLLRAGAGVLLFLSRTLVPGQMLLFSMFFTDAMGVRRVILQFGGSLVVLVMGSVVVSGGHCSLPLIHVGTTRAKNTS